ncbi:uncharacterized protein LOC130445450 [Diorhabda sublineata]|uniref:uncharacterized protein LOC130445450 n=1 Tax=Diorhabda sublineata TaxID=1163346 RepID=UPI0024E1838A|nr:uncharacterized protein LOC130445450 [Diorhabda sublineata]
MFAKISLVAFLVCALCTRVYGNLIDCESLREPGELVTWIYENAPADTNLTLRVPEYDETETPISCIVFKSSAFNVEVTDGGLGKNFVELYISPVDNVYDDHRHHDDDDHRHHDDDDRHHHDDDNNDDKIYYQLSVFRQPDDE